MRKRDDHSPSPTIGAAYNPRLESRGNSSEANIALSGERGSGLEEDY